MFFPISPTNDIHYLCYRLDISPANPAPFDVPIPIALNDQFSDLSNSIFNVNKLCNPVIKTPPGGPEFGNLKVEHLKCYDLQPESPIPLNFGGPTFIDQFIFFITNNLITQEVCLAADKALLPGVPIGGTLIPIDTTLLLLVGAQSIAAWMIPVIIAGIGIAIVIARKL